MISGISQKRRIESASWESQREIGDNLFPHCVLISGMHETSNAHWWDAGLTSQLTPLSLFCSLGGAQKLRWRRTCLRSARFGVNADPSNIVAFQTCLKTKTKNKKRQQKASENSFWKFASLSPLAPIWPF